MLPIKTYGLTRTLAGSYMSRRHDLIEPGGTCGRVRHMLNRAVTLHGFQKSPSARGQIGPVKDPVIHAGLRREGKDNIGADPRCREAYS